MRANEFVKNFGLKATKSMLDNIENLSDCDREEFERLVKSHELVEKATPEELYAAESQEGIWSNHRLKQAIADVESCL